MAPGLWLLDPNSIEVVASGGTHSTPATVNSASGYSSITAADLDTALSAANVELSATTDISFSTDFTYSGANSRTLTLDAETIALGANIDSNSAALTLNVGQAGGGSGNLYAKGTSADTRTITTNGGDLNVKGKVGGAANLSLQTGAGSLALAGPVQAGFNATSTTKSQGSLGIKFTVAKDSTVTVDFIEGEVLQNGSDYFG